MSISYETIFHNIKFTLITWCTSLHQKNKKMVPPWFSIVFCGCLFLPPWRVLVVVVVIVDFCLIPMESVANNECKLLQKLKVYHSTLCRLLRPGVNHAALPHFLMCMPPFLRFYALSSSSNLLFTLITCVFIFKKFFVNFIFFKII